MLRLTLQDRTKLLQENLIRNSSFQMNFEFGISKVSDDFYHEQRKVNFLGETIIS
jgi:hypothetical protein